MAEEVFVVADADTLFGGVTRGFLIHLSNTGVIQLRWSASIVREMSNALLRTGRQRDRSHSLTHEQRMRSGLPNAEVATGLVDRHMDAARDTIRSEKDAHVAACALAVQSLVRGLTRSVDHVTLITKNLKDFRQRELQSRGVALMHPDQFLSALFATRGLQVAAAFRQFRSTLRSQEHVQSVLAKLAADGQVVTASLLASAADAGDIQL